MRYHHFGERYLHPRSPQELEESRARAAILIRSPVSEPVVPPRQKGEITRRTKRMPVSIAKVVFTERGNSS